MSATQLDTRTAAAEEAVVGTLLAEPPDELPPYCARLLEHAPESFDDLRLGTIAVAIRRLREAGKPVGPLTVRDQLNGKLDDVGGTLFINSLLIHNIGIRILEFEATALWEAYRRRRVKSVCTAAAAAMESDPAQADAIADGVRRALDSLTGEHDTAGELLLTRIFKADIEPPPLKAVFALAGLPISTPGNLATITSAIKTGKSAVIGAMAAAAMPHGIDADTLGFSSSNPEGKALLWFDSEQSPDDFWHCVARALRRAGLQQPPPWLRAYCLTGLGCKRAWDCVKYATETAAREHHGIHSMLIDGVADLVADVNDPAESNGFVAELHDTAIANTCPIVGVIHFNPGSDKSRGHLGSQLERKAETNLALEKDGDGVTVIYSTKNRRAGIPKNTGPRFRYDDAAGMHVATESRQSSKDQAERERLRELAQDAFQDHPAMRFSDLLVTLKKRLRVSEATAERKIGQMKALTLIEKSVAGMYVLARPTK